MKRVLLDVNEGLFRVAYVEDGTLVELYFESKRQTSIVGNIYMGRVEKVVPNLQACFVDIGESKNAYLYYGEKRATSDVGKNAAKPKTGDSIMVQVEKDATGTKGAVVTKQISFPGKFLVLIQEDNELGVSRKITSNEERERIRQILKTEIPDGFGAIVRTNAEGKTEADFKRELGLLLEKSKQLETGVYQIPPKCLLELSSPIEKAVRDFYGVGVEEFVINDSEIYAQLLETGDFNGETQPKLKLYQEKLPLFEEFFVESQAKKAIEEKVWLKNGGFLVIQETEACVVIDVNSGKSAGKGDLQKAMLKTNLEAAKEVAKQLRLRNLSGIIIVDFIDMQNVADKNLLQKTLTHEVQQDRVKTVVVGMTELGLMQITRKKTRPSLKNQMTTRCRQCEGTGFMPSIDWSVVQMRREVETILAHTIYNKVTIEADGRLLMAFAGEDMAYVKHLENEYSGEIILKNNPKMKFSYYTIEKEKNNI